VAGCCEHSNELPVFLKSKAYEPAMQLF